MPAYEYTCKDCGQEFTMYLSIKQFEASPEDQMSKLRSWSCDKEICGLFLSKIGEKSQM
jgi:predicted nucleic acid-binding Zn ribbon protein